MIALIQNTQEDKIIRAFIAIELPVNIIDSIKNIQAELRDESNKVTWVKADNIHLTLKFLGNIAVDTIDKIEAAMKNAADDIHSFTLSVKEAGAFPSMMSPRVVWIGVKENRGANLYQIYCNLEDNLSALGFEKEARGFEPHLTLGRIRFLKNKQLFKERLLKLKERELGQLTVNSICLFKSRLNPEGAVYTKLKEIRLKA